MIAEDEPALRQNLQWMLEMEGFEVLTVCDGLDAFTQACAMRPDLLITDVMMPNMDGYALVNALREHPATATLPIIVLSAKADRSNIRIGMNLGADDYLTKPCMCTMTRTTRCARANCRFFTSQRRALKPEKLRALRRCYAGPIPRWAGYHPPNPSRLPKKAA